MGSLLKRSAAALRRRVMPTEKDKIKKLIADPPAVEEDLIVFVSSEDYSGNPKALFLYMIGHGYNERWRMVWLFEDCGRLFDFGLRNVSSVPMYTDGSRTQRTAAAQKAVLSARYVFCSHNVNWARVFRPEQTIVSLWHGCGYKAAQRSDKTKVVYDYLMVTGRKYIDIFREVMDDPDGNILDLGYPRNEMLFSRRSGAAAYIERLKAEAGASKAVIWMPTYRKSAVARLSTDVELGETGLPVVCSEDELAALGRHCREKGVLLIVKAHHLQLGAGSDSGADAGDQSGGRPAKRAGIQAGQAESRTSGQADDQSGGRPGADAGEKTALCSAGKEPAPNIVFTGSSELAANDADLYEFIGCTDALLTDYSSVAIDYMLLDRPLGYTLDDYEKYEAARGFSFEGVKDYMPGHHIYTPEDLYSFIDDVAAGKDPHAEWRNRVLPEMQTYRGGFSERILNRFGIL